MKTKTTWIASLLIATMGQTGAFAQDMHKVYPEKTIQLQEVANVRYILLGTTDDVLFNGKNLCTYVPLTPRGRCVKANVQVAPINVSS